MATTGPLPGPQPPNQDLFDEKLQAFDNVPLFMKSLPEDASDDPTLSALQNLAYEGTPDEIAQNFKEQGNDYFKGKRYNEARGFYNQAIDAKPTDQALLEALLGNRAACNLALKNYGSVLRDCSSAITVNPKSSKAYYRSGLALIALERFEEALDSCDRCLQFDSGNTSVQELREKAYKLHHEKLKKEKERLERLRQQQEASRKLRLAFKQRNLVVLPNASGSLNNPYEPHFDGDDLTFPVFFLYPQHAVSDVISEFFEDTTFGEHIQTMFPPQTPPPEWDVEKQYVSGKLSIYATTHTRRLLKVGMKKTLREVLVDAGKVKDKPDVKDGLELKEGCLTFVVLPKDSEVEKNWIKEYKLTK